MISKTQEPKYDFDVQLAWKGGRKGIVSANAIDGVIEVATPPEFEGGVPGIWSPEHLFLSSLSSCLMTTFFAIAAKRRLAISDFECNCTGHIRLIEGHLEFTVIDLFPKIYVEQEADIPIADAILLKTYKHCIIANSVSSLLVHHGEVLLSKAQVA
jgi:organic hydroperoxide reductase OsmC/OhrA